MRVELHEAIRALSQYLSSDTAYPFLVAANASSDLKELVRALPTRVHTVSMSDYCADDSLPDEDAVFNDPQSGNRTGTSATAKHKIRKQSLV